MNCGETTSARVIFAPAPFTARQRMGWRVGERRQVELGEEFLQTRDRRVAIDRQRFRMARMFCRTVRPRKIDGSCGR